MNALDYGVIDIVVGPHTPLEVAQDQVGVDTAFMDKVRMPDAMRRGIEWDRYVGMMDAAGVEKSLVIATRAGDLRVKYSYEVPYDRVAEYCAAYPGRFHGLAGVDPTRGMQGLRDLTYAVEELGFVGAHLYPHWFGLAPDAAQYYPYYAKCCELGIPIMMQVGHCLDYRRDRILNSVGRPFTLEQVAIDFPELDIIGIHLGWPWTEEMIAMSFKHANIYIAGDAYAPKHWPKEFVRYADSWGADKCLFGTDWPVIGPERAVDEVQGLGLRPTSQRKLLRDNAMRLFDLS